MQVSWLSANLKAILMVMYGTRNIIYMKSCWEWIRISRSDYLVI